MGKIGAHFRQIYWLSRFLDTMPAPPPKELKASELTDEQLAARYAHRCYYVMTGEVFDKKKFNEMMNGYIDIENANKQKK